MKLKFFKSNNHKYIKREGSRGNYKYIYREIEGKSEYAKKNNLDMSHLTVDDINRLKTDNTYRNNLMMEYQPLVNGMVNKYLFLSGVYGGGSSKYERKDLAKKYNTSNNKKQWNQFFGLKRSLEEGSLEREDLVNEANIAMINAIQKFDVNKFSPEQFFEYVRVSMKRKILREDQEKEQKKLKIQTSMNRVVGSDEEGHETTIGDIIDSSNSINSGADADSYGIINETSINAKLVMSKILPELNTTQKIILKSVLDGESLNDLSRVFSKIESEKEGIVFKDQTEEYRYLDKIRMRIQKEKNLIVSKVKDLMSQEIDLNKLNKYMKELEDGKINEERISFINDVKSNLSQSQSFRLITLKDDNLKKSKNDNPIDWAKLRGYLDLLKMLDEFFIGE
jgi:hypothetical protein